MTLKNRALRTAQRILRPVDLTIERWSNSAEFAIKTLIQANCVNRVLDVGAHQGEYVKNLHRHGWKGRVDSFEPDPRSFEKLLREAKRHDNWTAHHLALGSSDNRATLFLADNETSSSLREVAPRHVVAAPSSKTVGTFTTSVDRLDKVVELVEGEIVLLKIDVQGAERDVLEGASGILSGISMIQVEMSLVELYAGQTLWREIDDYFGSKGFKLVRIIPGFSDRLNGEMLQMDGVFLRRT